MLLLKERLTDGLTNSQSDRQTDRPTDMGVVIVNVFDASAKRSRSKLLRQSIPLAGLFN